MRKQTLQITTGGALIAIFAMILLINRQTGGFFEEMFFYILPIPMVAYSARYGTRSGIPVMIAMALISLIFGTVTTIFYAVTQAFLGLILGSCIYRKTDMTRALFLVMFLSAIFMIADVVVMSHIIGNDLSMVIAETREMFDVVLEKYTSYGNMKPEQIEQIKAMLDDAMLTRMYIIVMVMVGALQGFLVFEISLLLLNRLRFQVPRPRSVYTYYPPDWSGFVAIVFFVIYFTGYYRLVSGYWGGVLQSLGICAQLYLCLFGMIAVALWVRGKIPGRNFPGVAAAILCYFAIPILLIIMGALYIAGNWHDIWLERAGIEKDATLRIR